MATNIGRLRKWAVQKDGRLTIARAAELGKWYLSVDTEEPIKFQLSESGADLEAVAGELIAVLEQVGEEVPTD